MDHAPTITGYLPGALDDDLAALAYLCIRGWADQRPVTSALVRSRLRPATQSATTMIALTHHHDVLIGTAALRPPTPDGLGRLWGPLVHPDHRGAGHGRALLDALRPWSHTVTTAEIPVDRQPAHHLFTAAGWRPAHDAVLLKAPLPLTIRGPTQDQPLPAARVRTVRPDERLDDPLGELVLAVHPDLGRSYAYATFRRWRTDERYTPHSLAIAESVSAETGPTTQTKIIGAALLYPLAHSDNSEPTEALIAELLVHPAPLPIPTTGDEYPGSQQQPRTDLIRVALIHVALAGIHDQAAVIRAVIDASDVPGIDALEHAGLERQTILRHYQPPPSTARAPSAART
jgi:GNAT superfamily N-acetyltransferase